MESIPQKFKILDESNDRRYFTIVPNIIANGSTAYEQALYLQMKRKAGEAGTCYASRETLAEAMGVGTGTVSRTIDKLLKRGWIKYVGKRHGKTRPTNEYRVVDIWRENVESYKDPSTVDESTPTNKDASRGDDRSVPQSTLRRTPKRRTNNKIYSRIFEVWNSQKIIQHRSLTDKMKRKINGLIKDKYTEGEIIHSIENYGEIVNGKGYYFKYKWTLPDFLQRGFEKFLDLETAKANFSGFNGEYKSGNKPSEGKYAKFNVL